MCWEAIWRFTFLVAQPPAWLIDWSWMVDFRLNFVCKEMMCTNAVLASRRTTICSYLENERTSRVLDGWEQVNKTARFLSSDVLVLLQAFCPEFLTIWNLCILFETIRQGSQHTPKEAHLHKQFQRLALESAASIKQSWISLACILDLLGGWK